MESNVETILVTSMIAGVGSATVVGANFERIQEKIKRKISTLTVVLIEVDGLDCGSVVDDGVVDC